MVEFFFPFLRKQCCEPKSTNIHLVVPPRLGFSPSPFKNLTVYLKQQQQQQQQNHLQCMHPSLAAVVLCFVEKLSLKQLGNQVREGIVQDRGTVLEA